MFYGRVLRSTELSPTEKQWQVLAIVDHYSEGATHEHCPAGPDSWRKWQQDVACGTTTYRPPQDPLADAIVQVCAITFELSNCYQFITERWLIPLQRRHNEHDGISNQQHLDYLLNCLFRCRSKITQSSALLVFVGGNHQ